MSDKPYFPVDPGRSEVTEMSDQSQLSSICNILQPLNFWLSEYDLSGGVKMDTFDGLSNLIGTRKEPVFILGDHAIWIVWIFDKEAVGFMPAFFYQLVYQISPQNSR